MVNRWFTNLSSYGYDAYDRLAVLWPKTHGIVYRENILSCDSRCMGKYTVVQGMVHGKPCCCMTHHGRHTVVQPMTHGRAYCCTTHDPWGRHPVIRPMVHGRHWGQGVIYPVGTLWVCCEFWSNLLSRYPAGMWWVLLKCTHQSTHWVHFERNLWVRFKRTHQITQWVLLEQMLRVLSKVPINLIKMYSTIYLAGSLWVCGKTGPYWEFIIGTLKRTC